VSRTKVNERLQNKEYVLQVFDGESYRPITKSEFDQLVEDYPEIGKIFDPNDRSQIEEIKIPDIDDSNPIYCHWEKAAQRMMQALKKNPRAWIFAEPVKPLELGIPDYFDVIKKPMDFSLINEKLKRHEYRTMRQFLEDVELVFENCLVYNGENSNVWSMCKEVREEYEK